MLYRLVRLATCSAFLSCAFAVAAEIQAAGVHNFHQVNEHFYRGAQPTPPGFKSLAKLGIKTVIDLRGGAGHEELEEKMAKDAGLLYISVPFQGLSAPSDDQIRKVF